MEHQKTPKGHTIPIPKRGDFFGNLKNELTWHETFDTRAQARAAVFDYIELFYNRERIHQTLDYVSPVRYEERIDP